MSSKGRKKKTPEICQSWVSLLCCTHVIYTHPFFMKVNWDNMHSNFEGIDWLRCSRKIPNHFSKNISIKLNLGIIIEYSPEKILKQNGEIVHYHFYHNGLKSHLPQIYKLCNQLPSPHWIITDKHTLFTCFNLMHGHISR